MSKKINLLFTHTGTYFSEFLAAFSKAKYNHVSICIDENMDHFYSFGRRVIRFPLLSGFVVERLNYGIYKVYKDTTACIYSLEVTDQQYEYLQKSLSNFEKHKYRYGYNLIGLIGIAMNKPIKRRRKYFCSQFVASLLIQSNIFNFNKDYCLVTPQDIEKIPNLTKVFEGKLSDFKKDSTDCQHLGFTVNY